MDVHVARHLFNHCFRRLLQYKTRVLCTHQIQYAQQADYIILMDNGRILRAGDLRFHSETDLCRKEFVSLGKPEEVLPSAEQFLSPTNHSSQTSIATTHKSTTEIEEQVIQTENALQTEAEQRCTGERLVACRGYVSRHV